MVHFAGLDVSVNETSVCIVDETGRIVREIKVASEPEALSTLLRNSAYRTRAARLRYLSATGHVSNHAMSSAHPLPRPL
jgi:hypothetical protein